MARPADIKQKLESTKSIKHYLLTIPAFIFLDMSL